MPDPKYSRRRGPSRDELAIRWFTPRGRCARQELLENLRHNDGEHVADIVADLRRGSIADDVLDLRGIDLRGEDLAGANLAGADLAGCMLNGANLMRADLKGARLDFGSLVGVDMRGAELRGTRLRHADLTKADLREAHLEGALIDGCRLRGANLRRAWAMGVDFSRAETTEVDLSSVRREIHRPLDVARRRNPLGKPPHSEPRPPATRRLTFRATRQRAPALPPSPQGTGGFEEALAKLLLNRDRVGRIAVTLDGVEVVLFEASRGRQAA
jgi:hypothetical protein